MKGIKLSLSDGLCFLDIQLSQLPPYFSFSITLICNTVHITVKKHLTQKQTKTKNSGGLSYQKLSPMFLTTWTKAKPKVK